MTPPETVSPAGLTRDLAAASAKILGLEDRLAAAAEKVFRQAGRIAARKFKQKVVSHSVVAAAPSPEGTMVAVYPTAEQAAALAQEGGEPAEILHVTLAYLGKTTPEEADAALAPVRDVASRQPAAPLEGEIAGVSTFNPSEDENGDPVHPSIALPDVAGLAKLRAAVVEALDAAGISYSTDHEWTPHITISYEDEAIPPPRELIGQPVTFGALTLSRGDVPTHVPFGPAALTAATNPPDWTPPHADELVDVGAIVAKLHTKMDPIRQSAISEYGGVVDGLDWNVSNPLVGGVLAGAGQHVTNIAETTQLNVMRTIRAAYDQGLSIPDTAKAIQEGMDAASAARGRLIARTELAAVANGGSLAASSLYSQATGEALWKRWLTAPGAEHPRHEDYEGLDGQTVALDDLFEVGDAKLSFPGDPDGPPEEICNCFPAETLVLAPRPEMGFRRRYEGDLVRLETSTGHALAGTPNHPVLTDSGWKALGLLRKGDNLVCASPVEDEGAVDPHVDHAPAPIEEVFRTLASGQVPRRVRGRAVQFHGDVSVDPEVEVVAADGYLRRRSDLALQQEPGELLLPRTGEPTAPLSPSRLSQDLALVGSRSATGLVRGGGEAPPFGLARLAHTDVHSLRPASRPKADVAEGPVDDPAADPVELAEGLYGSSCLVSLAEIVVVERVAFAGDVFNLQTESGTYVANGIVSHNCRCALVYVGSPDEGTDASQRQGGILDAALSAEGDFPPVDVTGDEEAALIDNVFSDGFSDTQQALRTGDVSPDLTAALKLVDVAIGKSRLSRDGVALRGVRDVKDLFGGRVPTVGMTTADMGYASTTVDANAARGFATAKGATPGGNGFVTYHLTKGMPALYEPNATAFLNEHELLLPRGLPLRVVGVDTRDGLTNVHVEVVGRPVTPPATDFSGIASVPLEPMSGATPYALARPIIENAAEMDATVSAAVRAAVEPRGGVMEGLEFRVKSAPSVARKIADIAERSRGGATLQAAATAIKDGLRFTAVFEPDQYVTQMEAALADLRRAGIVVERANKSWDLGHEYAGTNLVMRAPNGFRFELQFHTPQSFDVKERVNHGLYQERRRINVEGGVPEAAGKTIDEIATNMGAHELDVNPEFRPDLFNAPIKLKGGGYATPRNDKPAPRVKTRADQSSYGLPPRIEDTVGNRFGNNEVVPGSERPPEYLYRAISEEDWQQAQARGYLQSDQRMNLVSTEGTVASFTDPSFYLPGKLASDAPGVYPGRIVRIKYRDEDGWRLDRDGYAKTLDKIPVGQIDLISPEIDTIRGVHPRHGGPTFETKIVRAPAPDLGRAAELDARMIRNADAVARPPGVQKWEPPVSVEGDLGVTPFRGGTDDPFGFYDSDRYKEFEFYVEKAAKSYGVTVDGTEKVSGVWQGQQEPSAALHVHDGEKGVKAFAAALGKVYDQEGVLDFNPVIGDDLVATFRSGALSPETISAAMEKAGIDGGTFLPDGSLRVVGSGPAFVGQLDAVAGDLGVGYDASLGKFTLLKKGNGDYEAALRDFAGPQGKPVGAPGGAVPELAGHPPLGEGAPGGREGPRQVAAEGLPPAPLPAVPQFTDAQLARMSVDDLWRGVGINGKIENLARADVAQSENAKLADQLWIRGEGRPPKGALRLKDVAGDGQVHTVYSDGHESVASIARYAQQRGWKQIVISDHSHLMNSADIARQHAEIDRLNAGYEGSGFKILKGIEANILSDGRLDVAPEVLAQFDVVNAAIHPPGTELGQLTLFAKENTDRLVTAIEDGHVTVLVHPHSVDANWDVVAEAAAKQGVPLEINGRDLLRNDRQDAAAEMIAAAKRHGAKLAIGSDAHAPEDLVDAVYAVRFAARHGVTAEDLAPLQRIGSGGIPDPSTSMPGNGAINLSTPGTKALGGGMNTIYKTELGGQEYAVKFESNAQKLEEEFGVPSGRMRDSIVPGKDLVRERAAYVVSRYFNAVDPERFQVYVPPYRISTVVDRSGGGKEVRAGVSEFIPGTEGAALPGYWEDVIKDGELRSASLFDAIIGNTDRHAKNFVFDEGARGDHVWLIDHALSFPDYPEQSSGYDNTQFVDAALMRFKNKLTPREATFLRDFSDRWPELSAELEKEGLPGEAIGEMRVRLDYMLENNSRRPAPRSSDLW